MQIVSNDTNKIHAAIKKLIEQKTKRDRSVFTVSQLAKALDMPHSILVRLIHADPKKRVNNPRIDTLTRIVDFFRSDGFDICVDDLLNGFPSRSIVNIQDQRVGSFTIEKTLPVYSLSASQNESVGVVDVRLTEESNNLIALIADVDVAPMFKKNSVFIVDVDRKPKNDTLIVVRHSEYRQLLIGKFNVQGHKIWLTTFDAAIAPIPLLPTISYSILGVIIQVNAKT